MIWASVTPAPRAWSSAASAWATVANGPAAVQRVAKRLAWLALDLDPYPRGRAGRHAEPVCCAPGQPDQAAGAGRPAVVDPNQGLQPGFEVGDARDRRKLQSGVGAGHRRRVPRLAVGREPRLIRPCLIRPCLIRPCLIRPRLIRQRDRQARRVQMEVLPRVEPRRPGPVGGTNDIAGLRTSIRRGTEKPAAPGQQQWREQNQEPRGAVRQAAASPSRPTART